MFNKIPFVNRLAAHVTRSMAADGGASGASTSASSGTPITLPEGTEKAAVAAGCFWGVEHIFRKQFAGKGLVDARVGYIGGAVDNPTYRGVCGGGTGHAEATLLIFNPSLLPYRTLVEFFYRIHDPTTLNRQGNDVGTQYRSAIFTFTPEQAQTAKLVTQKANEQWWNGKIATEIVEEEVGETRLKWWDAEDYHQEYLHKNSMGYQCPSHRVRAFSGLNY